MGQAQCRLLSESGIAREQLIKLCEQYHWHDLLRLELDTGDDAASLDEQGQPMRASAEEYPER